ncbi:MAG TPA: peptidyl-prolyl cis-trans isomerase [Rhodothermales bacterium]|nr:peptidyl-prolyl cis-trans isomerase [Rhodothermales bacterium]
MTKLRDSTGIIMGLLIGAFLLIWLLSDSGMFQAIGNPSTGRNIAIVNGDPITIDEYNRAVNGQMDQYQSQTGESMPPQMVDLTRDRVYEALVEDRLAQQQMEKLGINVTDQEIYDMVLGPNPHPIIQTYFGDGKGGINRTLLQNFAQDPGAQPQWIQLEQYLRSERRREKLAGLIASSVRVTDQDVIDEYNRRNRAADAQYVALRYAAVPDDSVNVTEDDLRAFYDEHEKEFERPRTVRLNYVTVSKAPTPQDTVATVNELAKFKDEFAAAENDSTFLAQNGSEQPYSSRYVTPADLDPKLASAIFPDPSEGRVIGPIVAGTSAHLVKVEDVQPATQEAIRAQHILFRAQEGDEAARAKALLQAQDVKRQIQSGASFEEMARKYSDDASAAQGGDLGWFQKGRMVKPFEDAAFSAPVGRVVGPVETQFGYHLIEVTNKADKEVKLADFTFRIRPDVATLNKIQETLDDLQYYATESHDFANEAKRRNLNVRTVEVEADQQFIPGVGNSRKLTNFIAEAEQGGISDVIELNDQFIVAEAAEVHEAGVRPFDAVKAELEPRVKLEKKKEIQVRRLENAIKQGNLDAGAEAVGQPVQTASNVGFSNPVIPGLGREPEFVGTTLGLEKGETSGVIDGENAAYVIKVTEIREPAPPSDAVKEQLKQQMLQERRSTLLNQWLTSLKDQADIQDFRRRFEL